MAVPPGRRPRVGRARLRRLALGAAHRRQVLGRAGPSQLHRLCLVSPHHPHHALARRGAGHRPATFRRSTMPMSSTGMASRWGSSARCRRTRFSISDVPPQTYGLGPIRSGVLAVRVWKMALASNDPDNLGGFEGMPVIGSPNAIAAVKGNRDFNWLRSRQFRFRAHVALFARRHPQLPGVAARPRSVASVLDEHLRPHAHRGRAARSAWVFPIPLRSLCSWFNFRLQFAKRRDGSCSSGCCNSTSIRGWCTTHGSPRSLGLPPPPSTDVWLFCIRISSRWCRCRLPMPSRRCLRSSSKEFR